MDLPEEQLAELKGAFALFDKKGKGAITVEELTEIMCSLGQPPIETQLKKIISEVDIEGTGRIDFADFVQIMTKQLQTVVVSEEEQMKEVFKVFDKGGQGVITAPNLKEVLMVLGVNISDEELGELIALADKKGQGKIDFEAFYEIFKTKPKEAPTPPT